MSTKDGLVIIEKNVPLADSRVVAEKLGVKHRPFLTNIILKYQEEVEADFAKVHFQSEPSGKTNQQQIYALLTEEQVNVYMSYTKNTEQARKCKRMLVKAFSEAKKIIAEMLHRKKQETLTGFGSINELSQRRLMANFEKQVHGYWTILREVDLLIQGYAFREAKFAYNAYLDTSIGLTFNSYLRSIDIDPDDFPCIDHIIRWSERAGEGITFPVKAYPDSIKPVFHKWLHDHYWPHKFINYAHREYKGEVRVQAVGEAEKISRVLTAENKHLLVSSEEVKLRRVPKSRRNAS